MFGVKLSESKVVKILERRIQILEARETDLLNRLMAKDYGEYVLGKNVLLAEKTEGAYYPEDALESNAGEFLETET